jgi:hypothetical protein
VLADGEATMTEIVLIGVAVLFCGFAYTVWRDGVRESNKLKDEMQECFALRGFNKKKISKFELINFARSEADIAAKESASLLKELSESLPVDKWKPKAQQFVIREFRKSLYSYLATYLQGKDVISSFDRRINSTDGNVTIAMQWLIDACNKFKKGGKEHLVDLYHDDFVEYYAPLAYQKSKFAFLIGVSTAVPLTKVFEDRSKFDFHQRCIDEVEKTYNNDDNAVTYTHIIDPMLGYGVYIAPWGAIPTQHKFMIKYSHLIKLTAPADTMNKDSADVIFQDVMIGTLKPTLRLFTPIGKLIDPRDTMMSFFVDAYMNSIQGINADKMYPEMVRQAKNIATSCPASPVAPWINRQLGVSSNGWATSR